jgi:2-dehydro-3-deoxygluconokinase
MSDLQLLSVGDASLDVFITPTESETLCRLDDKDCLICFSYGDKIPAKDLKFSVGGNAANNAVGCKRLGVNSAVVLTLGDDDIGTQVKSKLEKEGVDTSYIFQQPNTTSNYSSIVVYSGERTIFTYKTPREYEFPEKLPVTSWLYLTSMGESFKPVYDKVVEHVKKNPDVKLAFNPGSRQLRVGVDQFKDVLAVSYAVYINRKEAETITGLSDTRGSEKVLLQALCKLGPKVPIVTDGVNGSFVFDGSKYYKAGVLPIDSYERTGAGDSFGAGCISALIKGKSFEEALLWGTMNSASVIGYAGAQRGLLKEDEMPKWLEKAKSCKVEVGEF